MDHPRSRPFTAERGCPHQHRRDHETALVRYFGDDIATRTPTRAVNEFGAALRAVGFQNVAHTADQREQDGELAGQVHHSDRGVQYLSIRYSQRLADAGAVTSVGSREHSNDNALAETTIGPFKTEVIARREPWRTLTQVEAALAEWVEWVDWYNHRRLHEACGDIPPVEYEQLNRPGSRRGS